MKTQALTPKMERDFLESALKLSTQDSPPICLHVLGQGAVNLSWYLSKMLQPEIQQLLTKMTEEK